MNQTALKTVFVANVTNVSIRRADAIEATPRADGRVTYHLDGGSTVLTTGTVGDALASSFHVHVAETFKEAKAILVACLLAKLRWASDAYHAAERAHGRAEALREGGDG